LWNWHLASPEIKAGTEAKFHKFLLISCDYCHNLVPDNIRDVFAQRYQGSRYSFSYPACLVVMDHVPQLQLLGCDRIGISIDESEPHYRSQTTTAFVTYHPVARYFSA